MIWNLTPHPVNIIAEADCRFDASIRKWVCDTTPTPIAVIPSDGVVSAKVETAPTPYFMGRDSLGVDIPIYTKRVVGCDPLPDSEGVFIVSALYASAYCMLHTPDESVGLMTIADPVYTPDGRTVLGCKGICPYIG